jgi:hypothetical protein
MTKPIVRSRKEALAIGNKFYCDGQPCRNGHRLTIRYTSNGACVACFSSPRYRFLQHRANSQRRGIPFRFSFESWLETWGDNLALLGIGKDKLCMSRPRDKGSYKPDRVEIITHAKNVSDGWINRSSR